MVPWQRVRCFSSSSLLPKPTLQTGHILLRGCSDDADATAVVSEVVRVVQEEVAVASVGSVAGWCFWEKCCWRSTHEEKVSSQTTHR